jgi:elongation factor P--(R)-beta-lysine ligase
MATARFESPRARWQARCTLIRTIRQFFFARDFLEVDTPVALRAPAPEPHIEAPTVNLHTPTGQQRRFLQPSPELPMKRLIANGSGSIFQIAAVFRDGEFTPQHRPEFRLLEWYRVDADWTALMADCESLLRACAQCLNLPLAFTYQKRVVDLTAPFLRIAVEDAFQKYAGFSILDHLNDEDLRRQLRTRGITCSQDDSWDDLFHRAYLPLVEPALTQNARPIFLTHYPAPLAALARLSPTDPRVAERFELFIGGVELANAYSELINPVEQRERFLRAQAFRRQNGHHDYPLDERFLAALEKMPPTAGIALGIDRLLMIFLDAADIDEVQFLPWEET